MSNNNINFGALNMTLNKAGAAVGTTTTHSFTANPLLFTVNGKMYTKATVTNGATPTTDGVTGLAFTAIPVNGISVFAWCYDAGGNTKVVQGSVESMDIAGNALKAPNLPVLPDTMTPFAYLVTKVGSTGAAWTMGTSNLATTTGVTQTFVDVAVLPDRPQVA